MSAKWTPKNDSMHHSKLRWAEKVRQKLEQIAAAIIRGRKLDDLYVHIQFQKVRLLQVLAARQD